MSPEKLASKEHRGNMNEWNLVITERDDMLELAYQTCSDFILSINNVEQALEPIFNSMTDYVKIAVKRSAQETLTLLKVPTF